jgi:hypothetical protein
MAKLSPVILSAQFINGIPANGAKLFTYAAGSSTKQTTYTSITGLTPQTNPIILDSRGEPAQPIWLTEGLSYKFVFTASTDSDPPVSPIWDIDNVTGINDNSASVDQWSASGVTPTYVSATQFTLAGDQTSAFHNKRRIKALVTAGTVYGTIFSSVFGALTTVTVVMDSTPLDSGLSSVQLALLTAVNQSIPSLLESYRETIVANATTTPLWTSIAQVQDWTGAVTVTNLPAAPRPGAWREVYPAAGTIFTDNANIDVQGDTNYTVVAGDKVYIEALTTTTFKVFIERKSAQPIFAATNATSQSVTTATATKVTLGAEIYDSNSNFASSRFTPTVAGYYQINGTLRGNATNLVNCTVMLYVNGAEYRRGGTLNVAAASAAETVTVSEVIYFNGTTDYVELWGIVAGTTPTFAFVDVAQACAFSGHFIRA